MSEHVDNAAQFAVVVNDEMQYAIWPAHKPLPAGWRASGMRGSRQECIDHVDAVWSDMRPLSLRNGAGVA